MFLPSTLHAIYPTHNISRLILFTALEPELSLFLLPLSFLPSFKHHPNVSPTEICTFTLNVNWISPLAPPMRRATPPTPLYHLYRLKTASTASAVATHYNPLPGYLTVHGQLGVLEQRMQTGVAFVRAI